MRLKRGGLNGRIRLAAGGTQAQLDALVRFAAADGAGPIVDDALDEVERLVVQFAAEMTRDIRVSDAVFAAMRRHFDETAIVELTTAVAAYNMVARILRTLDIEPELPQ